jgi:predicted Fe-S protein YdhL (DUF1289 family)
MFAAAKNPAVMPIPTPCRKICIVDPPSGLCVGCGRTLDEIARWITLTDAERAHIMAELPRRTEERLGARACVTPPST